MLSFALSAVALAGTALAQNTQTSTAAVAAAQATAKTSSPTSFIPGAAFDRIAILWLENTDYDKAIGDPNLAALAKKSLTLSNYFGTTHPSEPNYVASIAGDNFGMDNDDFTFIANNVSTVIDLLEARGISWGAYQEDMPYSGFEGFAYVNQKTKANDYVRKHDPPIIFNKNSESSQRLSQIKNFTLFNEDLAANKLPQWMFITPNMTDDGHDTSVTVAGQFINRFVTPLLENKNFMERTLMIVTFDETETYTEQNRVLALAFGDALPANLVGTTDANYYNHYSLISTVEANWGLNTLGRWDVGANVLDFVGQRTGDRIRPWPAATGPNPTRFFNQSYAGPFDSVTVKPYPAPNVGLVHNGRTVLPSIFATWFADQESTYYTDTQMNPDGLNPPRGYAQQ